jgi:hypothetical protein
VAVENGINNDMQEERWRSADEMTNETQVL